MGAHVHVVQPVDIINDKYVLYGLGNFLSNQSARCCPAASQNGIMAFVEIVETGDGYAIENLSFVPTRVDRNDYTIVPVAQALKILISKPGCRALPGRHRRHGRSPWQLGSRDPALGAQRV